MPQDQSAPSGWVSKLSLCLRELVDYEYSLEHALSDLRRRASSALGIPGTRDDRNDDVRERVAWYWPFLLEARPGTDSEYRRFVSSRLDRLVEVLLEHPVLKRAVYRDADGQLTLGLNLAASRNPGHQLSFVLTGLLDHAVEHTPEATADAFARMIQQGEDEDLVSYSILLFRGLHIDGRHDFPKDLSIISFGEARRYLPDDRIRSMLEVGDGTISAEPVAAVVSETRWGPLIVPAGFDLDQLDWPKRPASFRDEALLLLDGLAVTHGLSVTGARTHTRVIEREIEHIAGHGFHYLSRFSRDVAGYNTRKMEPPSAPAVLEERLPECERLLAGCGDDIRLRLALSRLASSLSRTGVQAPFDCVLDAAIALDVMYDLERVRDKRGQLSRRARSFIGRDREDRNWIRGIAEHFYAARKTVVHEGTLPEDHEQVCADAFELGRRTLLHAASSGLPDWGREQGARG